MNASAIHPRVRSRTRSRSEPPVRPRFSLPIAGRRIAHRGWFRVGLVAARELPRDRTTLLIRLMAAGPLLASAVPEVAKLAPDAPERAVAEPILLDFQRMLGQHESRTSDEQEFLMAMQQTWEDVRTAAHARDVLTVLRVRGIAVPDAVRQRIQTERDQARLERWLERAIVASSITEVIDDAS